jgi:hypothetical protein
VYVRIRDLGAGPGLNLDFARYTFQVPMIGSGNVCMGAPFANDMFFS